MNYIIEQWAGVDKQKPLDGILKNRYKSTAPEDLEGNGLTEDSLHILIGQKFLKTRKEDLKNNYLPIHYFKAQYDGLLSLYWFTDDITLRNQKIESSYELIEEKKWDYVYCINFRWTKKNTKTS